MAAVKILKSAGVIAYAYFVTSPVGIGKANRRDDVLLVQFFLAAISSRADTATQESFKPPGAQPFIIDGIWGPNSQRYLNHFLATFNRGSQKAGTKGIWADGVVDVPPPGVFFGALHHQLYAIVVLNATYREQFGTPAHAQLHTNGLFPKELTDQFYT